jgi:hypothetical protein
MKKYRRKLKDSYQHVSFSISGDSLKPENITTFLGIKPDDSWKKNDFILNYWGNKTKNKHTGRYSKYDTGGWILESKAGGNCTLENKINHLISELLPKKEKLIKLSNKYTNTLCIVVEPHYDVAVKRIPLSAKLLKTLSVLGIDVDLRIDMPHIWWKFREKFEKDLSKKK